LGGNYSTFGLPTPGSSFLLHLGPIPDSFSSPLPRPPCPISDFCHPDYRHHATDFPDFPDHPGSNPSMTPAPDFPYHPGTYYPDYSGPAIPRSTCSGHGHPGSSHSSHLSFKN